MTILVTGAAGFIGSAVCERLLRSGHEVIGVDSFNDACYDNQIKRDRARNLYCRIEEFDIRDQDRLYDFLSENYVEKVVHLAAIPGVRYAKPRPIIDHNIAAHATVLDVACAYGVPVIYASSSSVYGRRASGVGFKETDTTDAPASLYAMSKKSAEMTAQVMADTRGLNAIGLRLFSVYGPWGRPDMAYFNFARKIVEGSPIKLFGSGRLQRDFTHIDDVTAQIEALVGQRIEGHDIYNVGRGEPCFVLELVEAIAKAAKRKAILEEVRTPETEVPVTHANIDKLIERTGITPVVSLKQGVEQFWNWFQGYYRRDD